MDFMKLQEFMELVGQLKVNNSKKCLVLFNFHKQLLYKTKK